ncbi:MAG: carbohydrate kinase [Bacteroidota bacterium]
MNVISFGEILWDIIEGTPYIGGAPFNFAAHLSQCGAEVAMISRLGKDELGERALEAVKKLSVDPRYIQWDSDHPTGTVDVFLKNGQPSYTIHPEVAYDYIAFDPLQAAGLLEAEVEVFGFGTLAQRHPQSQETLARILAARSFQHVFYDVNLRKDCYNQEIIQASVPHSTVLKLNDEEVPLISDFLFGKKESMEGFARRVAEEHELAVVIITAGAQGCYIFHGGKYELVPGRAVTVVDTVGAGDSFSAAFMFQYVAHGDPFQAASVANQVGGFVAASRGPIPTYTEEIKSLLGIG